MDCFGFNTEFNVLTDEQGIMIPLSNALDMIQKLGKHLGHSPLEMEAIGRKMLEASHPHMVSQFNFEWFDYTVREPEGE